MLQVAAIVCMGLGVIVAVLGFTSRGALTDYLLGAIALILIGVLCAALRVGDLLESRFKQ